MKMKVSRNMLLAIAMIACTPIYAGAHQNDKNDGKKSQGEPDDNEAYVEEAMGAMCDCFSEVGATTVEDVENMGEKDAEIVYTCLDELDVNYPYMDEAIAEIGEEALAEIADMMECSEILNAILLELYEDDEYETSPENLDDPADIEYVEQALTDLCTCFDQVGISTIEEMEALSEEEMIVLEDCILQLSETYPEMEERIGALSDNTYKDLVISMPCAGIIVAMF